MIDTAGMRVIRAIAEHGSFTAAAASLGYSQPAVSQMVRRLEQRTGTPLVERLGRTVRLTEAGEIVARHAVTVLAALQTADDEVAAIAGLRSGRVRLVSFPSSSASLVPRALADVRAGSPGIAISLTEAEPPQSLQALRSGDCDIAIAFAYEGSELTDGGDLDGLHTVHLLDDAVRLALPRHHPLAGRTTVDIQDLGSDQWIAGCPRCRGHLMHLARSVGFEPEVAFETEDYVAVLGLVAEGLGVALVPDLILRAALTDHVATAAVRPSSARRIYAVTTPDLLRVPAVAATVAALERSAAELGAAHRD